jgi:hypothetical protein
MATDLSAPEVPAVLTFVQPIVMPSHKRNIGLILLLSQSAKERSLTVSVFFIITLLAEEG